MLLMKRKGITRLKWGVAGLGSFAEHSVIPAFRMVQKADVAAVYSGSPARAKAIADRFSIPASFTSFEEFLASGIQAVYIGSANDDHHWQVIQAARAGKHILCDKPLALTSAQAMEMRDVCVASGVQCAVNFVYRYHPLVIKAKELIEQGMIGKIISVRADFQVNVTPSDNYRYKKESGGGALRDLGPHMLDVCRFLGGEISSIQGHTAKMVYQTEVDDYAAGSMKFANGGTGYFSVAFCVPRGFNRIEIVGSKGSISVENLVARRLMAGKLTILLEGEYKKVFNKRANKLLRLLKSVNRSFLKNEVPSVTIDDGVINMKLIEMVEGYEPES